MAHCHCVRFASQQSNASCIDPTATGLCPETSSRIAIATFIPCLWSGLGHCVKANRPSKKQCCPLPLSSQPMDVLHIPCQTTNFQCNDMGHKYVRASMKTNMMERLSDLPTTCTCLDPPNSWRTVAREKTGLRHNILAQSDAVP